jgi:hypothetical protein
MSKVSASATSLSARSLKVTSVAVPPSPPAFAEKVPLNPR